MHQGVCAAEGRLQSDLTKIRDEITTLQAKFDTYKEETERRQTELREDFDAYVKETELKEFCRNCDNTLCYCISDVYRMIVQQVKKTHPSISNCMYMFFTCGVIGSLYIIISGQDLVRQARNNPEMQSKIETIYRDMGFTDAQWNALRSFKSRRNGNSHCSDDYVERASVIVAECLGDVTRELREALQHVITLLQ